MRAGDVFICHTQSFLTIMGQDKVTKTCSQFAEKNMTEEKKGLVMFFVCLSFLFF